MKRPACLFLLLWCGLAWANVPPGPLRSLTAPVDRFAWSDYDSLARLNSTALANRWGHVLDGYGYGMDNLGLRTNIIRNLGLTTSTVSVGYDAIGQLFSWSAIDGTNNMLRRNEQFGWAYDRAGNLRWRTNDALVQAFNTDTLNQLTNITRTGPLTLSGATPVPATNVTVNGQPAQTYADFTFARTNLSLTNGLNTFTNVAWNIRGLGATNIIISYLPSSVSLQYDLNGNLSTDGTRCFAYDSENELISVGVTNTWRSDFVYDGLGRRRIERDYGWQGSTWGAPTNETRYLYDGWLVIQERDSNNVVRATYTRGLDLSGSFSGAGGIGGLLALSVSSAGGVQTNYYYHADGAGNVTGLIDANENMAARYMYGAFGKLTAQWGPMAGANAMQFSSMVMHRQSGMSMYLFRGGYDPTLQRWIQRDPIGEIGGINLYGFVGNNPMSGVDPYGLSLYDYLYQAGQGIYDFMMGDHPGKYDPNSLGTLDAQMGVVDIDRDNNVLRNSMGAGLGALGEIGKEIAIAYGGGKVAEAGLGIAGAAVCKAKPLLRGLGNALPAADAAAGEGANLVAAEGGALRFSQTTASPWFSSEGSFAGQTISDVAGQLRAGTLTPAQVPVQVVTMDGTTLIVNTRSSLALSQAGIPQSSWNLIDMTGNANVMNSISTRLVNNGLTTAGTPVLRITASGSGASTYFGAGTIPRP